MQKIVLKRESMKENKKEMKNQNTKKNIQIQKVNKR